MDLHPDFNAFIGLLNAHDVRYLVVGGYAVAAHGHPRYTGDLDVWLLVEPANARAVVAVLDAFGFSEAGLEAADFLTEGRVVQLGFPPVRIDLLTTIDGVRFEECEDRAVEVAVGDQVARVIALDDLLANKRASGRAQDLADVVALSDPDG